MPATPSNVRTARPLRLRRRGMVAISARSSVELSGLPPEPRWLAGELAFGGGGGGSGGGARFGASPGGGASGLPSPPMPGAVPRRLDGAPSSKGGELRGALGPRGRSLRGITSVGSSSGIDPHDGSAIATASSSASSLAVWNRASTDRARAFSNHVWKFGGRSGRKVSAFGKGALAIWANVIATPCSVDHTVRPVKHSYVMQPSAQRSAR